MHAAVFALSMPMSLYALGLGEMTVKSSLNQPFLAEIELIDVKSTPIPGIKVGIADPDNFEQIGMERTAVLSLLNFKIEKNEQGKFIIKVQSLERMTEPYMELVVDLTWPNGQLYKAYTVLLDPPGYQLVATTAQSSPTHYKKVKHYSNEPGVIDKTIMTTVEHNPVDMKDSKKKTTYGPTITNENVWQIAQRYKTSEVILPQVVLAIVGANPDAFKDGNLNGLKVGIRLAIPSTQEILQVPGDLATEEVMAHDKAWNEKTAINHVLTPPYMNGQTNSVPPIVKNNEVSGIPKLNMQSVIPEHIQQQLISANTVVPVTTGNQPQVSNQKSQSIEQDARMKAEISITTAAVESVRESNALLMEQLHLLQAQNKILQQQLAKREKDLDAMHHKMEVLLKERLAVASQVSSAKSDHSGFSYWPLWLLLLVAAGGGGFAYWYFRLRERQNKDSPYLTDTPVEHEPSNPLTKPEISPAEHEENVIPTHDVDNSHTQNVEMNTQGSPEILEEPQPKISEMTTKPVKKAAGKKKKESPVAAEVITIPEGPAQELQKDQKNRRDLLVQEQGIHAATDDKRPLTEEKSVIDKPELKTSAEDKSLDMEQENLGQTEDVVSDVVTLEAGSISDDIDEPYVKKSDDEEPVEHEMLEFETGLLELIQKKPDPKSEEEQDDINKDEGLDFVPSMEDTIKNESITKEKTNEPEQLDEISFDDSRVEEQSIDSDDTQPEMSLDEHYDPDLDQSITDFFAESEQDKIIAKDTIDIEEIAANSELEPVNEKTHSLKSSKALNTLLDLAKTYIGMDDFESARHSLDEVLEHGCEAQKAEARNLLVQIKDK